MAVRMVSSMAIIGYQVKQSIVTNCDDFVDKAFMGLTIKFGLGQVMCREYLQERKELILALHNDRKLSDLPKITQVGFVCLNFANYHLSFCFLPFPGYSFRWV